MADRFKIEDPDGSTYYVPGDLVSGEFWPAFKIAFGSDGVSGTLVSSSDQLPISAWANTAKDGSGTDYIPLVDSDGHLQIDVLSGTVTVGGTVAVSSVSGTVTVAGTVAVSGTVAISGTVVVSSGTVSISGTAAVTQSGTWNITNISGTISLPTGAATAANQATANASLASAVTALQIIDDWDESDRAAVNLISGQAGVAGGSGALAGNVLRVTLATDDPAVDGPTSALRSIDYAHHEIHGGSSYTCHYANDVTNTGEMTVIAFNTPDTTKWLHLIAEYDSTAASYFAIYESPSIDVNEGTDLTIYNRDRNSDNTSGVSTIEGTPEAGKATSFNETQAATANISTTTELERVYLGAGDRKSVGASSRGTNEFILKQDTQYAFMLVALTDDDCTHQIRLSWYEHTNS